MRILLVEDDARVAEHIAKSLGALGHTVNHVADGRDGLFRVAAERDDAAILDRMLPNVDGLTILKTMRANRDRTPVLILSALDQVDDRVQGLKAGGDDYLVKPFAVSELAARLEVLARRRAEPGAEAGVLAVGDLEIDLMAREVRRAGRRVDVTDREFRILEYMARNAGRMVTRSMLLENVWKYSFDPQTNTIDQHVSRLRQKLSRGFERPLLHTVRGAGTSCAPARAGTVDVADLAGGARRLWLSLTFRLALAYAAVFTVSVAVLVAALYYASVWAPLRQVEAGLDREMAQIQSAIAAEGDILALLERRAATPSERRPFHLLLSADGAVLGTNMPRWPRPLPAEASWLRFEFESFETADEAEYEVLARVSPLPGGGRLLIGRDTEDLGEREELLGQAVAWGSAATILAGLLGGILMTYAVGRRIEAVRRTAEQVMEGDLARRIPVAGSGDDFDRLADTLNAMLGRIEALVESVRRVSDSVAHELRTPLTHLRVDLEELAHAEKNGAERQRLADQALSGAERLQSTFDALLRIARVETGQLRAGFRPVDLSALLVDVVELYQPAAEDREQRLITAIPAGLEITGDPDLLFQAVANLIDNAVKYGPPGSQVRLTAERRGNRTAIVVSDGGPGVPEGERERVLERFYRLAPRAAPGLGLSFVRSVAETHGGSIRLAEGAPGTVATLTLPAGAARCASARAERWSCLGSWAHWIGTALPRRRPSRSRLLWPAHGQSPVLACQSSYRSGSPAGRTGR